MFRHSVVGFTVAFAAAALAAPAAAQNFDVQQFQPANGPHSAFATEGARTIGHFQSAGALMLNYSSRPLVIVEETDDGEKLTSPIVDQQFALHAVIGVGLFDRIQVDLDVPFYLVNEGELPQSYSERGLGDLRLRLKGRITGDDEGFGAGVALDASLPTGSPERYVGEPNPILSPRVVLDYDFGPLIVMLNAGARFRQSGSFGNNIELGNALTMGLGAELEVMRGLLLVTGDIYGRSSFDDFFASEDTPIEGMLGGKIVASHGITITGAAGGGLTEGAGAATFRMIMSIGWAPRVSDYDEDGIENDDDECPDEPEDLDQFEDADGCPELDNDRDTIPDTVDQCPLDPEDADDFQDEDGCPEPDNDGDGIEDVDDACPMEAEDIDGFEDQDGCPEPDNDGDGINDADDKCPMEAEDADGFEDEDGCPDIDNDRDKIPDSEDQCPDEAGFADTNGCPPAETKAVREAGQIKILDKVFFETAEAVIKPESFDLLKQVGLVLTTNDDILKVEVGGHTDDRGNGQKNLELSQRRADAVRQWLIEYGIAAARLDARGFGEDVPIQTGRSKEARAANRRVEFKIVDPAPKNPATEADAGTDVEDATEAKPESP